LIDKIAGTVDKWPDDCILVVHAVSSEQNSILESIRLSKEYNHKIFIHNKVLPFNEIDEKIFSGADIGLAFYDNINSNFNSVAYSSGKLSHYLKSGLPVITSTQNDFRELTCKYDFGISTTVNNIGKALKLINEKYDDFSENAIATYLEIYKYENYHNNLMETIDEL